MGSRMGSWLKLDWWGSVLDFLLEPVGKGFSLFVVVIKLVGNKPGIVHDYLATTKGAPAWGSRAEIEREIQKPLFELLNTDVPEATWIWGCLTSNPISMLKPSSVRACNSPLKVSDYTRCQFPLFMLRMVFATSLLCRPLTREAFLLLSPPGSSLEPAFWCWPIWWWQPRSSRVILLDKVEASLSRHTALLAGAFWQRSLLLGAQRRVEQQ